MFVFYKLIKTGRGNVVWFALIAATVVFAIEGSPAWRILAAVIALLGFAQLYVLATVARRRR